MITAGGYDIVGLPMVCEYQGSKDPAPVSISGKVVSYRTITGKGTLIVVHTANGYRSIYMEKAIGLLFTLPRFKSSDDGYDAAKDRRLERYGMR
jgi:hypothetical protein